MSPLLDNLRRTSSGGPERSTHAVVPPRGRPRRTRVVVCTIAASLVIVIVVAVAWSTAAVRRELRGSFSRLPSSYTELYFSARPSVEHATAVVPVTVVYHGTSTPTYQLHVWIEASDGHTTASTTTTLAPRPGTPTATVTDLPLNQGTVVHVALAGTTEALHFRLAPDSSNPTGAP